MEDASVEIMGRDGQLQNPEVNMWYLFKVNLLNTFSCTWTKYTLYILFKFIYEPDRSLLKNCWINADKTNLNNQVFKNQVKDFEITFTMY